MKTFKVFKNETLGRIFMPDCFRFYEEIKEIFISPIHGRAVSLKVSDYEWISVKGGGWNYGGPQVYISNKDEELIFGLYPFVSAQRELAVSKELEKVSSEFPKVLCYKKISDYNLPNKYQWVKSVKFRNGNLVEPCLLYTKLKCPYRVSDLNYLSDKQKRAVVNKFCDYWKISQENYIEKFIEVLGKNIAIMHKNGFINDTLDYGNVTLLAEVVDYEWITAPNIKLLDGTYGLEISEERKEKEILYVAEICLQLKALLHKKYNLFNIYDQVIKFYNEVNPQFISKNINVNKMRKREKFIL